MQYLTFLFSDFARLEFVAGQQFVRFQEALSNSETHANVKSFNDLRCKLAKIAQLIHMM